MTKEESDFTIITIQVTEEDIKRGIPKNPEFCPIALAVGRYTVGKVQVAVSCYLIAFINWNKSEHLTFYAKLPHRAKRFVYLFDQGIEMLLFSFRLTLPKMILKERMK